MAWLNSRVVGTTTPRNSTRSDMTASPVACIARSPEWHSPCAMPLATPLPFRTGLVGDFATPAFARVRSSRFSKRHPTFTGSSAIETFGAVFPRSSRVQQLGGCVQARVGILLPTRPQCSYREGAAQLGAPPSFA